MILFTNVKFETWGQFEYYFSKDVFFKKRVKVCLFVNKRNIEDPNDKLAILVSIREHCLIRSLGIGSIEHVSEGDFLII